MAGLEESVSILIHSKKHHDNTALLVETSESGSSSSSGGRMMAGKNGSSAPEVQDATTTTTSNRNPPGEQPPMTGSWNSRGSVEKGKREEEKETLQANDGNNSGSVAVPGRATGSRNRSSRGVDLPKDPLLGDPLKYRLHRSKTDTSISITTTSMEDDVEEEQDNGERDSSKRAILNTSSSTARRAFSLASTTSTVEGSIRSIRSRSSLSKGSLRSIQGNSFRKKIIVGSLPRHSRRNKKQKKPLEMTWLRDTLSLNSSTHSDYMIKMESDDEGAGSGSEAEFGGPNSGLGSALDLGASAGSSDTKDRTTTRTIGRRGSSGSCGSHIRTRSSPACLACLQEDELEPDMPPPRLPLPTIAPSIGGSDSDVSSVGDDEVVVPPEETLIKDTSHDDEAQETAAHHANKTTEEEHDEHHQAPIKLITVTIPVTDLPPPPPRDSPSPKGSPQLSPRSIAGRSTKTASVASRSKASDRWGKDDKSSCQQHKRNAPPAREKSDAPFARSMTSPVQKAAADSPVAPFRRTSTTTVDVPESARRRASTSGPPVRDQRGKGREDHVAPRRENLPERTPDRRRRKDESPLYPRLDGARRQSSPAHLDVLRAAELPPVSPPENIHIPLTGPDSSPPPPTERGRSPPSPPRERVIPIVGPAVDNGERPPVHDRHQPRRLDRSPPRRISSGGWAPGWDTGRRRDQSPPRWEPPRDRSPPRWDRRDRSPPRWDPRDRSPPRRDHPYHHRRYSSEPYDRSVYNRNDYDDRMRYERELPVRHPEHSDDYYYDPPPRGLRDSGRIPPMVRRDGDYYRDEPEPYRFTPPGHSEVYVRSRDDGRSPMEYDRSPPAYPDEEPSYSDRRGPRHSPSGYNRHDRPSDDPAYDAYPGSPPFQGRVRNPPRRDDSLREDHRRRSLNPPPPPPPPPRESPRGLVPSSSTLKYRDHEMLDEKLKLNGGSLSGRSSVGVRDEPISVEIAPGVRVPLRRTHETMRAIAKDYYQEASCFGCSIDIFCIADVSYVICPKCKIISPVSGEYFEGRKLKRYGLGLGFTCESLFKMQNEILQDRTKYDEDKQPKQQDAPKFTYQRRPPPPRLSQY
ncbi:expressed unknown protein [Seminavis robusta]|uniref:Uncharacterized protein n=1 Tax=Seminavis robusta TaxID=568900 RepID=A0A9N8H4B9_9STRA|nr:expressed unknown protein [Seminavis robusta]|eukprot:Sro58_g033850.1 n/a (1081) ;mRNA; f:105994-109394